MITYEFVTTTLEIVKIDPELVTEDYVLATLELKVPHALMRAEGADHLQIRVTKAVEKMVEGLNAEQQG